MENQHRKIKGYRELSQEEVDLMNEIKNLGDQLEKITDKVDFHICNQRNTVENIEAEDRLDFADPEMWAHEAKKSMKQGLMYLTRAVAQPTTF